MKRVYEIPELIVEVIDREDIITTSLTPGNEGPGIDGGLLGG